MAKEMTFDKYIDNPSGGSVFTNRNMYKTMYKDKFDKILLREQGAIKYALYVDKDNIDSHYVYLKIPSEVISNFYYDVVIQLYTNNNSIKNEASLRRYSVKFYSNDPAFVYTFAHSFNKNGLFISDLESKMSRQALRHKATVKNPKDDIWYVKSLFFAYLAMEKYNLFSKPIYDINAKQYRKKELLRNITQAESKVAARQEAAEKLEKEKKKELERQRKEKQHDRNVNVSTTKSNVSKISKTSKVSKVSKTSNISKKSKITSMKRHT